MSQLIPLRLVQHQPAPFPHCIDAAQVPSGVKIGIRCLGQGHIGQTGVLRRIAVVALHVVRDLELAVGGMLCVGEAVDVTLRVAGVAGFAREQPHLAWCVIARTPIMRLSAQQRGSWAAMCSAASERGRPAGLPGKPTCLAAGRGRKGCPCSMQSPSSLARLPGRDHGSPECREGALWWSGMASRGGSAGAGSRGGTRQAPSLNNNNNLDASSGRHSGQGLPGQCRRFERLPSKLKANLQLSADALTVSKAAGAISRSCAPTARYRPAREAAAILQAGQA